MNPHKLSSSARYAFCCPFDAMSFAQKIDGDVFRYTRGSVDGAFDYAVSIGYGAVLYNTETMFPCDQFGNRVAP
jgi:hypothetical protein